ncbi:MAG: winged helix DNA-binding domain-containing protein, partial [Anaerolineae bacterium]|nr:winged helix DNA-binding domain-containing protein [Anaerolineae bacterium]
LPGFDEYLLAYQDRGVALDPAHAQLIQRGGMFAPAIVIEGRVVGTWQRAVKKRSATITLQPFAPLSDSQLQAISDAAQRYGAFLGLPVEVH